jgi:dimethylargininase
MMVGHPGPMVSELIALTRAVSPAMAGCELTHLPRVAIDARLASAQHAEYERVLRSLGCTVQRLGAGADMPDSVFIEDIAVVLDEIAILTRPGAESRRAETPAVAEALHSYRPLARIDPPGTMDGGDVLVAGRSVFVGCSSRTNMAGIDQMRQLVAGLGYALQPVSVRGCLHLKSAVTAASDETLLMNPAWARTEEFRGFDLIDVDPGEAYGANIVRVLDRLLYSAAFPRTHERLERRGFEVMTVDVSEIAKAEGAVTCCSLIFNRGGAR